MGKRSNRHFTNRHVQMANEHLKISSYVIRDSQLKKPGTIRLLKSKTLTIPNAGKNVEQRELSFTAGGNAKWYSHLGRQFGSSLQN